GLHGDLPPFGPSGLAVALRAKPGHPPVGALCADQSQLDLHRSGRSLAGSFSQLGDPTAGLLLDLCGAWHRRLRRALAADGRSQPLLNFVARRAQAPAIRKPGPARGPGFYYVEGSGKIPGVSSNQLFRPALEPSPSANP